MAKVRYKNTQKVENREHKAQRRARRKKNKRRRQQMRSIQIGRAAR